MIFYATPIEKFKIGHATSTFTEIKWIPLHDNDCIVHVFQNNSCLLNNERH